MVHQLGKPYVARSNNTLSTMSPLEILASQLDEKTVDRLGQRVGANPRQAQVATAGIVNTLFGAMAREVQQNPAKGQRIERALERDNHASLLDNLGGLLGGATAGAPPTANARSTNGMGILRHILGNKTGRVADQVSKSSGLSPQAVGQMMVVLAPFVMGALGKARQQQQPVGGTAAGGGIAGILGSVLGGGGAGAGQQQATTQNSWLKAVLDRDGDGSGNDDLVRMGTQLLGGFFKR